jgi:cysteine sulfinate desulfinase/cysteine desulfurase-like protein
MATENERIRMLRDKLLKGLSEIEEVYVNGDMEQRVPHNLNISFNYVEGESLIMAIKRHRGFFGIGPARRHRSSRRTFCARLAATMSSRTARSALRWGALRPSKRSTMQLACSIGRSQSCASCRRCGRCTRKAWT